MVTALHKVDDGARPATWSGATVMAVAVRTLAAVAVVAGTAMRAWYIFHRPLSSDEAIAGLMAHQILHGHFSAFYWGQSYGGVEPYVTSGAFAVFGSGAWVLRAVPIGLAAVAAILTWRVTRRLVGDGALAALAGAVVWATPESAVANSFIEWGFRGVTLVCGMGMLLLALRILDGDRRWRAFAAVGVVSGLGWWSSPEIVYFAVPTLLLLAGAVGQDYRAGARRALSMRLGVAVASAAVGALPWLWANVQSGLQSIRPSAFGVPAGSPGYFGRLKLFFHYLLAMLVSLRDLFNGHWLGGKVVAIPILACLLAALTGALALCLLRGGRSAALAVAVIVFPFLLAESPATWLWQGGRYVGYVVPLYVMVLAIGATEGGRWLSRRRILAMGRARQAAGDSPRHHGRRGPGEAVVGQVAFGAVAGVLLATALAGFVNVPTPGQSVLAGWGDPNRPAAQTIRLLERGGVTQGYANYWVAYRLDYLSHERLRLTVGKGETDRWPSLNREVARNREAAWLFVKSNATAGAQFGELGGPGGLSETTFLSDLQLDGVPYRLINTDLVVAVLPQRPVPASDFRSST